MYSSESTYLQRQVIILSMQIFTVLADRVFLMEEERYMWEILVPAQWTDGSEVSVDHHHVWDTFVNGHAKGGMTIFRSVRGRWDHEGEEVHEAMIPVRLLCSGKAIEEIITFTLSHYHQVAVLAYCISQDVRLRYAEQTTI